MGTNYITRDNFGMYAGNGTGPGPELMGANTLLGNDVYNKDGEDLGDIKEFMIDMASGKLAYAVLSFGGLLGMGDKLFAVPWAALALDTVNKRFTLNVLKEALKSADKRAAALRIAEQKRIGKRARGTALPAGAETAEEEGWAPFSWKHNALRHSFISYRVSQSKNVAQVALEAGNSPGMIFKHYHELVQPDAAKAWFAIVPAGKS